MKNSNTQQTFNNCQQKMFYLVFEFINSFQEIMQLCIGLEAQPAIFKPENGNDVKMKNE